MVAVKRARVLMCLGVGQQQKSAASMGRSLWKPTEKKVIVLAGPTGVGKTAVSLELAKRLGRKAEIISADSVQVSSLTLKILALDSPLLGAWRLLTHMHASACASLSLSLTISLSL